MHIPDGYISPKTFVPAYLIFVPLVVHAYKRVRTVLDEQTLPMLSSLAALSFVIMMFNIPVPGGTSGHAIGTAVISILFGPWIAFLALSVVLLIQALVFGDGGITTYAINALSMGFIAAFTSYYTYKFLRGKVSDKLNYFISGWFSIVMASFFVAVLLGIQPIIAKDAAGHPLYFPFGLNVSIPALVGAHVLFFGVAEGLFTMITVSYIKHVYKRVDFVQANVQKKSDLWYFVIGLLLVIALVPLGLLTQAPAWGEWDLNFFKQHVGIIPQGIKRFSDLYFAPLPDYSVKGLGDVAGYYISAFVGVIGVFGVFLLFTSRDKRRTSVGIQQFLFLIYILAVSLIAISNNVYFIVTMLAVAFVLSGKKILKLLWKTVIVLFVLNFIVSAFYLLLLFLGKSELNYYSLILFNLRSFTLLYLSFLMIEKVNIFSVFAFSKTLSFLLLLSYSQILSFRRTLQEFSLAYKSRTINHPHRTEFYKFISGAFLFFIKKALINSTEIYMALKSRSL